MTAVSGLIWKLPPKEKCGGTSKQPAQQDLFASWVELGEKFYEAIIARPVPLDMRTLQALKSSSLALDIYAWLAYRSHRVNRHKKAVFVS